MIVRKVIYAAAAVFITVTLFASCGDLLEEEILEEPAPEGSLINLSR